MRVGLARFAPSYAGVEPPFGPGRAHAELVALLGDAAASGPPNPAYAALRAAVRSGAPSPLRLAEIVAVSRVVLAAFESQRTGCAMVVDQ